MILLNTTRVRRPVFNLDFELTKFRFLSHWSSSKYSIRVRQKRHVMMARDVLRKSNNVAGTSLVLSSIDIPICAS